MKTEGIAEYFKEIYGTDDLPELKPSPLAFQPILDMYKPYKPEDFLMIGDMPSDLEAGKEAGFWTIGIASGISKKEVLADWGPDILVDSIKELNNLIETRGSQISKTNIEIKI